MILSIMLVALGFLIAALLALLIAPAFWRRAERLTSRRIEQNMPMSIAETEADRDQIRASYAIIVRRLEASLSKEKMRSARQLVEISRLQMEIANLKDQTVQLRGQLEAEHNAASVLRRTIATRVPELNRATRDARQLVHIRDREIDSIVNRLRHREEALEVAQRTTDMQQAEIARLRQAMEMSGAQNAGRFKLRPTQWTIHDYRAEYDRLNVELSKLRERLSVAYDREANQVTHVRTELQQLADQITTAASNLPEGAGQRSITSDAGAREEATESSPSDELPARMRPIDAILSGEGRRTQLPAQTNPLEHSPSTPRRVSSGPLSRTARASKRLARDAITGVKSMTGTMRGNGARATSDATGGATGEPSMSAANLLGGAAVPGQSSQADVGSLAGSRPDSSTGRTQAQPRNAEMSSDDDDKPGRSAGQPAAEAPDPDNRARETQDVPPARASDAPSAGTVETREQAPSPHSGSTGSAGEAGEPESLYHSYRAGPSTSGKLMEPSSRTAGPSNSDNGTHQPAGDPPSEETTQDDEIDAPSVEDDVADQGGASGTGKHAPEDDAAASSSSNASLLDRLKHVPENEPR